MWGAQSGAVGVWIGEKEILGASWTLIQNYCNCTGQLYYLDPNVIPSLKFWVLQVDIGKENNHIVGAGWKHLLHLSTRWHSYCCHGTWNSQQGNSFCMYVCTYVCMYDNADSDIRWTNMKYSHSAHLLHHWQLLPCHCLQSLKIFVHTLDILNMNLRHFIGLVEIISSDCTFLFCHTNLALFINILFGWKVASTIWAVYAIVCYYYSVLILKQRCLTFTHDVYKAIQ